MTSCKLVSLKYLGRSLIVLTATVGVSLAAACSPQATPTPTPTHTPRPTVTPLPTATPVPTPRPLELTVLHTNDVVGYTEPCG